MFGNLEFRKGDYIIIPRGIIYKMTFQSDNNRLLVIESRGAVRTPKRYRNAHGQLLEHAPFSERDFRLPEFIAPVDKEGEFQIELDEIGEDLFSQVANEYITQLNREIKEVHVEMDQYGLVAD